MRGFFSGTREERRRRFKRNLFWIVPAFLIVGTGFVIGLGHLVVWLWRVTLVDIFGIKPISFWQAWGLILLSQILFKANMQSTTRTGGGRRHGHRGEECAPEPDVAEPERRS